MKKLIKTLSVVAVLAAVLMMIPSPGYSFRNGEVHVSREGHWRGAWRGYAPRPYYRAAWGYPYYRYSYYAGYPVYVRSYHVVSRRTVVRTQRPPEPLQPAPEPTQPAPEPKQDRN